MRLLPRRRGTWGQSGLWRRLVDICSNSTSQGFLLWLPQQLRGCTGPGRDVGSVLFRPALERSASALPSRFFPSPSRRRPEP